MAPSGEVRGLSPAKGGPQQILATYFSSNVHRSNRGGGKTPLQPRCSGSGPPHNQVCLCLHLVLCLRCCDCTLLPPWDICISRLCNKCCILSRSCNSLRDGDRERGSTAFSLYLMSLVSELDLPQEAPYGMNVNCPLPAASRMSHPRLGPQAGVDRVPPTSDHKSTMPAGTEFNATYTSR